VFYGVNIKVLAKAEGGEAGPTGDYLIADGRVLPGN